MKKSKSPVCLLLIYTIWLSLFAPFANAQTRGLQFNLRESATVSTEKPANVPPNAADLSKAETEAILRRLPPMPTDENSLQKSFAIRSKTNPPPRTGNVIPIKFPADEKSVLPIANAKTNMPLEVVRFAPDGKIPLVSDLSVTFSQPMIAVASQAEASENVPVQLTPQVKGRWRWLGTTTLIFDAESRFPMAQRFSATIPAGTKSAIGGTLAKAVSWTFSTPPPKVEKFVSNDSTSQFAVPDQILSVKFNQEIDENAVLPKIVVSADGRRIPIRLMTKEIDESYTAFQSLGEVKPKHWLAFRAIEPLPLDSEIKVTFEKGLPSAEGNLTSEAAQEFSFKTYAPFKFVKSYCGYYSRENVAECEPSETFHLEFNNSFYPVPLDVSRVKIEPPLENAKITASHNQIFIEGVKAARTTYKITVSPPLKDWYQQTLGNEVSAIFKVGSERPRFFAQGANFVNLDPQAKPKFSFYSRNQPNVKVKIYAVTPDDWNAFREVLTNLRNRQKSDKPFPGKLVFDQTVATGGAFDELTETRVDLSAALQNGFGQLVIFAEPDFKPAKEDYRYSSENQTIYQWIQVTNIGLDAFVDNENIVAFATDLKTGKPLADTRISLFGNSAAAMTDENGLANLALPENIKYDGLLVAESGADTAMLPEKLEINLSSIWHKKNAYGFSRWSVFNDRGMYRPQETVEIKGYVRRVTGGKFSDIAEFTETDKIVFYKVKDARNNEVFKGQTTINNFGAFDLNFRLPDNLNLGNAFVAFGFDEDADDFSHQFQVQEFRRPEYEVTVKATTDAPYFVGESAALETEAKYYSGGFLTNAPVDWTVYASQTKYTPPNRDDFNFGSFERW